MHAPLFSPIRQSLSRIDGKPFLEDIWTRPGGGGGRSRVLQGGNVFEKAGVNVSVVSGHMPKAAALQMLGRKKAAFAGDGPFPFYATGVSLVIHPINPMAPTMHANFRLFEVTGKNPEVRALRALLKQYMCDQRVSNRSLIAYP